MNWHFKDVFRMGIRQVVYSSKFMLLLWGLSLVTALILSMPVYHIILESLQNSFIGQQMAEGFDFLWLIQFRQIFENHIEGLPYLFIAAMIFYLVIQNFFSGGLVAVFNSPKKNHVLDFFYGGVKYWYRFLKVLLVSLALYITAFLVNDLLAEFIRFGFINSENAMAEFILKTLKFTILIFLIGVTAIISDYARVIIVAADETSVISAINNGAIFIKKNFNLVFSVFIIISITGAFGVIIYNAVGRFIPRTPYYFLIVTFFLQQMLVIFRLFIRMLFYSTEVLIYKDISAEIIEKNIQEVRS